MQYRWGHFVYKQLKWAEQPNVKVVVPVFPHGLFPLSEK